MTGKSRFNMHVSEIDTPALVVDLDIFERNLARVADYAREHASACGPTPRPTNRCASPAGRLPPAPPG